MTDLVVPGLVGFLVAYFLTEKTKTMENSQKPRFLIKFIVIFFACMLVASVL
jgi:multisubunit Na+/H+ antiporter MnhE subunit